MTGDDEKFWAKVRKGPGCWEWTGAKSVGYGMLRRGGRNHLAHRYVLHLEGLDIPTYMDAHHTCHNRACVNPDHLVLEDPCTHRGGHGRKRAMEQARLTPDQVRHIRRREMKQREYADLYDISRDQISTVQNGRSYAWVSE